MMKMDDNNKRTAAIMQMYVMMCLAIGGEAMTAAIAAMKKKGEALLNSAGNFRVLSIKGNYLILNDKADQSVKLTHKWYRYMANTIGLHLGEVFYTLSGNSGFNASNSKAASIAIFQHLGLIDEKLSWCFTTVGGGTSRLGNIFEDLAGAFGTDIEEVFDEEISITTTTVNEFEDFEEVVVSDSVNSFNVLGAEARVLYPMITLLISFFEAIKTCGSAVGTVLNYGHITAANGQVRNWRPSEGALLAIKNNAKTYKNGKGQLKELKCITTYVKDGETFANSLFGYTLAAPVILRCLGFNTKGVKKVYYDMLENFCGKDNRNGLSIVAGGMRLILNAIENGAPANQVGVGFVRYLDDEDINKLIDAYTKADELGNHPFYDRLAAVGSGGDGGPSIAEGWDQPLQ
jgi:hypothetical protein